MIKVVKFGGSSLADAVQIKKAGKIVLSEESRRYVVPSAPGKRFSDDTKVTDMLYRCYGAAVKEKKFTELLADIQKRYQHVWLLQRSILLHQIRRGKMSGSFRPDVLRRIQESRHALLLKVCLQVPG